MPLSASTQGADERPRNSEWEAFRSVRRRRRWVWLIVLSYLPVGAGVFLIGPDLGIAVAVVWMIALCAAAALHSVTRCPRCGRRCFHSNSWHNQLALRCLHCRTRLYWRDKELSVTPDDSWREPSSQCGEAAEQRDAADEAQGGTRTAS
jgi:hypothetical protein